MHKRVEKLIAQVGDKICIQYIFSSFNQELESSAKTLIGIYLNNSIDKAQEAFNEWFNQGKSNHKTYFKKYNINIEASQIIAEYQNHQEWKNLTKINATPTVLVNGYILPKDYKITDLVHFIDINFNII